MNLQPVKYPSVLSELGGILYEELPMCVRASWGVDETRLNRTYTLRLRVTVPNRLVGPVQIFNSFPVAIGSNYQFPFLLSEPTENDTGSFLQSVDLEPESEDGLAWIATLNYGPYDVAHQLGTSDIGQGIIDPTDRAPEVYYDRAKYKRTKPYDESVNLNEEGEDTGGKPYVNTVGDPLLDPPDTEETRPTLKFVRNEATYNDSYAAQWKDTVNSDEFLGYPPNTVKCADINAERIYDTDWGYYFRVTYDFEFRDDDDGNGYTKEILNAGYRQLVGGAGDPVNVTDANGNTVTDAVPLQEDGSYDPTADPYFLQFQEFAQLEFKNLNIPDDLLTVDE
jgi:hypothetical protein